MAMAMTMTIAMIATATMEKLHLCIVLSHLIRNEKECPIAVLPASNKCLAPLFLIPDIFIA